MKLSDRLSTLCELTPRCPLIADIGADHAFLTIELLNRTLAEHVLCTDLHEKPLEKARREVARRGLDQRVTFCLGDGLDAIRGYCPEAVVIAGMGGETILDILKRAEHPKGRVYLLQPMTRAGALRRYLYAAGFATEEELLAEDAGLIYPILRTRYDGVARDCDALSLLCGRPHLNRRDERTLRYLSRIRDGLVRRRKGREKAACDTAEEEDLIAALNAHLS